MSAVRDVLPVIRERITSLRDKGINEMSTRAALINPMLKALGWDNEDLDQVQQEYRFQSSDNPVDYALMEGGKPSLFVEAKALGKDLGDQKWASQIMGYAIVAGVEWVVLTDGNEYRVYNTHAPVPVAEKLFHAVRVIDEDASAGEILDLLSSGGKPKDRLKAQWHAHFVDRQMRRALTGLFGPEPDESFVSLLKEGTVNLTDEDVAASLRRVQPQFEFPLVHDSESDSSRPPVKPPVDPPPVNQLPDPLPARLVRLPHLIAAGIIRPPLDLRKTYLGQPLSARIETDGTVTYQGKSFRSLSTAGNAARIAAGFRGERAVRTGGWMFWRFTDSDGQVREIDVLRQRYLDGGGESDAS